MKIFDAADPHWLRTFVWNRRVWIDRRWHPCCWAGGGQYSRNATKGSAKFRPRAHNGAYLASPLCLFGMLDCLWR